MNNAHFAQPQYLWLIVLVVPALAGFFYWSWRVKQKLIRQFISPRLLGALMMGVSHRREKARLALIIAAVALVFVAMARPEWGFVWEEARQQGLDILVAVDTSRSMLAQDVPPNRLERAKLASLDLMHLAKTDRLGLIAFAGTAFLQSPLTLDEEAFRQSVDALNVNIIPQGGTALSSAIRAAMDAFEKGNDNHKVLVLMTDGEDHDTDAETMAAAKEAAEAGLMIFTIGVGTPEGELLRVTDDQGNSSFVKDDEGNVVKSRLNQTLLQQIATTAKGFYLPLQGADPMKTLYDRGLAPLPKTTAITKLTRVFDERYHWPLGLAILCLALEIVLPESTTGRRRKAQPAPPPMAKSAAALAAASIFVLTIRPAAASPSSAYRDYQNGKYDSSLDEYSRLSQAKTNDYRLHYDAGAAAYQTKEYDKALQQFNSTLQSPAISSDLQTQEHTYYDLGNTFYRKGEPLSEPDQKKQQWDQAVQNYGHALQLNTNDVDARNNLAYVKQKLEQLKQQQQQQQKQNNKDQDKDQKNKDDKKQGKNDQNKDQKDKQDQKQNSQEQKDKQKQQQSQNDKQKQDEEKKKQEQQAQQDKEKKDKDQEAQANQTDQRGQTNNPEQGQTMMAQMTPQEARQLLDAQRDDEKALIFQPTNMPAPPVNVRLKDW